MCKILDSFFVTNYTVLVLESPLPIGWKNRVYIDGTEYETEIVYDIPNAIAIKGKGDFEGKSVEFV